MIELTLDEIRELLQRGHVQGNDTPTQTLDRVWNKHIAGWGREYGEVFVKTAPRRLTMRNVHVSREEWPLERLAGLPRKETSEAVSGDMAAPVIIVRHAERDCLLDGRRRVSAWCRAQDAGPHPVNLVEIV